jgi:hypothetical protein
MVNLAFAARSSRAAQARPFHDALPRDRHMQLGRYEGAGHQAASLVRAQGRNKTLPGPEWRKGSALRQPDAKQQFPEELGATNRPWTVEPTSKGPNITPRAAKRSAGPPMRPRTEMKRGSSGHTEEMARADLAG